MAEDDKGLPSPISEAIERLMANPQLLSSIASSLGAMRSVQEPTSEEPREEKPKEEPKEEEPRAAATGAEGDMGAMVKTLAPLLSSLKGAPPKGASPQNNADKRSALLYALKPYVSPSRQEAIDYIVRISQVSDILRNMN